MAGYYMYLGLLVALLVENSESHGNKIYVCSATSDSLFTSSDDKLNERIVALEEQVRQLQKLVETKGTKHTTIQGVPSDCEEIHASGVTTDGVYAISPDGRCPFYVFCDMKNGGWTVLQRRLDGSVNFYRPWNDYVTGFGKVEWEHWLGLEKIHRLTKDGVQIYFDMEKFDGLKLDAHYKVFTVHGAATSYKMNVDAFGYKGSMNELLSFHDNMKFSTYDRDNDASGSNCCKKHADGGGWWFNDCYRLGLLNSVYGKKEIGGIGYWEGGHNPLKNVTIKVSSLLAIGKTFAFGHLHKHIYIVTIYKHL